MASILSATALTSVANVQSYSGNTSASTALVELLINGASAFIERLCGRKFKSASYVEYQDGDGGQRIFARQYPITAIAKITEDDVELTESEYTPYLDSGIINRENGWSEGVQNIKIEYSAGYAAIPADLEMACIKLVTKSLEKRLNEGASSVSGGGTSISWEKEMDEDLKKTIEIYKKIKI